ncbi:MAG: WG repeat-containing protein [Saprospiraceae bacterium]|nr:WG repeat-containing protein [Saprospiraceae bacterium]
MKSFIILLSCLLCISSIIFAQNTKSCYTELRREGLRYVSRKDYPKAINSFFAARYCLDKPAKDELIKNTQNEWVKALNNALAKSDSLIAYFGFTQDRAWAYKNGKFAVIDRNGKRLTDFEFENPEPFKESGYAIAQKADGFYYLIDKIGKISEPYNDFFPCNNGWYKVKKGNLYTFYDKNYKQVEGWDWYEDIYDFREGIAMIQQNKKWGIIKLNGSYLIAPQFDGPFFFSEGLAAVLKDKKWCYIDTTRQIVLTTELRFFK